ncbi:hypothetical protein BT96DRAFT_989020 [Gymnopus androsaceus JB14]|uniref:Uncharacterized protein n=1 Tax=Gymnopus androsaceus JB14 TaxID=1447944 RepID=A0A6A4I7C7_9AGAR|nr:hypothetical protein BT96DRAFT_989020 [Gymnopus androsaceus JB14]
MPTGHHKLLPPTELERKAVEIISHALAKLPSILRVSDLQRTAKGKVYQFAGVQDRFEILRAAETSGNPDGEEKCSPLPQEKRQPSTKPTPRPGNSSLLYLCIGNNSVFRKCGRLWVWDSNGRLINAGDPLRALVYDYRVPFPVHLTKISFRQKKSAKDASGDAKTIQTDVLARNGGLDYSFNLYRIGLKPTNCKHVAHDFTGRTLNIYGAPINPQYGVHVLHARPVSPSTTSPLNPPAGIFWWHYLQCVISKFGRYNQLGHITHYEKPILMQGDPDFGSCAW